MTKKVAIIMGSDSDLSVMMEAADKLKQFDIPYEVHIISAHRTPAAAERFASAAVDNGFGVIIAGAGKAAHLGGVLAAYTTLPVIGVPIKTSMMGGWTACFPWCRCPAACPWPRWPSTAPPMPPSWLRRCWPSSDAEVHAKLVTYKSDMEETVLEKDAKLQRELAE